MTANERRLADQIQSLKDRNERQQAIIERYQAENAKQKREIAILEGRKA